MFGQITDMPFLRNYAEALKHYESIKPIRGSNNLRPICDTRNGRRKKHMEIRTTQVNGMNAVTCRLYDTDVVTYLESDEVWFKTGGWSTNTTHDFADKLLAGWGNYITVFTKNGRTELHCNGEGVAVDRGDTIKLKWDDTSTYSPGWKFVDKPQQYEYRVNRKAMNKRMREMEPFITFTSGLLKVMDFKELGRMKSFLERYKTLVMREDNTPSTVDLDAYSLDFLRGIYNVRSCFTLHEIACSGVRGETATQVAMFMLVNAGSYSWGNSIDYPPTTQAIRKTFGKLVKHLFFDEVFMRVASDRPPSNNNEKFVDVPFKLATT